jgi:hypothetical protein
MARRRIRPPFLYDSLYYYFAVENANREGSYITSSLQWTTVVNTRCDVQFYRPPLIIANSWCTPANSVVFAKAPYDSCHFSFLLAAKRKLELSPIVMTCRTAAAPGTRSSSEAR